jgi:hypothetical protein
MAIFKNLLFGDGALIYLRTLYVVIKLPKYNWANFCYTFLDFASVNSAKYLYKMKYSPTENVVTEVQENLLQVCKILRYIILAKLREFYIAKVRTSE